ncbi:MAG: NitT/TauT family transport system permease protein [Acidimicrobiaceae bacterium]|nr:MAG: NitT/TauT family transport system permease protein [Acidimicrobiaceae bacterium]
MRADLAGDEIRPASATAGDVLDRELSGLDHLELAFAARVPRRRRVWQSACPKVAAVTFVIAVWQVLVWREWRPENLLPSPTSVGGRLWDDLGDGDLWRALGTTMRRALVGFGASVLIGGSLGLAVTRFRWLRIAVGSLITGMQTMPSIAWFPLAILLFQLSEQAVTFVVILGAAPSIANGIIAGVDGVAPILRRVGNAMGAGNVAMYRDFIVPAAMPGVIAGMKQGWAFSWRSLLAGELLVAIPGASALGARLQSARKLGDAVGLLSTMVVILVIGVLVDGLAFRRIERSVLRRRGLVGEH